MANKKAASAAMLKRKMVEVGRAIERLSRLEYAECVSSADQDALILAQDALQDVYDELEKEVG